MKKKDKQALAVALGDDYRHLRDKVGELESINAGAHGAEHEYVKLLELECEHAMKRFLLRLLSAFAGLNLPLIAARLTDEAEGLLSHATEFDMLPWVDVLWNSSSETLEMYYEIVQPFLSQHVDEEDHDKQRDRARLLSVLESTPKIVSQRNLDPSRERDVETAVFEVLEHFFPTATPQVSICKAAKTYKPDLGIRSLETAVEYKYANSEAKLKSCFDGILTDIHGYSDSKDWTQFIALIYTTSQFWSPAKLKAVVEEAHVPENWKFVLVTGPGS